MSVRRNRILFVDHVSKVLGGAEVNILELLASPAAAANWECHVACAPGSPLEAALQNGVETRDIPLHPHQFAPVLNELRIVGRGLQLGAKLRGWQEVRRATARLRTVLEQVRPDAVISCTNKDHFAAGAAAHELGIPSIWWNNDILSGDFFPLPVRIAFSLRARRFATRLAPVSEFCRSALIRAGIPPARCVTVHNGIPLSRYRRSGPAKSLGPEPVFGIAGRITPWKGQQLFLDIAADWIRSGRPGHFVLLGRAFNEDAPFDAALREFIRIRGLEQRIRFLEFQSDMAAALASMDVLLHCSTRPEPFGRVLIEAMAVGVPVIGARGGGVPEIITDDQDGLLAATGDVGSYSSAMQRLVAEPGLADRLVTSGRETVARRFTVDRVAADFARLVDSVVGSRTH
jgi:glycosyltransferase involved in cell wall biosynthesis